MLIKYGYHGIYPLSCLFEEAYRQELFRQYVGQALWNINQIQNMKVETPNEMPQLVDLLYPSQEEKKEDAQSIINNLLIKLGWDNGNSRNA